MSKPSLEINRNMVLLNVNRQAIDRNTKRRRLGSDEPDEPVIRIQRGKHGKPIYCDEAAILDAEGNEVARLIYGSEGAIVGCGARLVLVAHHGSRPVESVDTATATV